VVSRKAPKESVSVNTLTKEAMRNQSRVQTERGRPVRVPPSCPVRKQIASEHQGARAQTRPWLNSGWISSLKEVLCSG